MVGSWSCRPLKVLIRSYVSFIYKLVRSDNLISDRNEKMTDSQFFITLILIEYDWSWYIVKSMHEYVIILLKLISNFAGFIKSLLNDCDRERCVQLE